MTEPVPNAAQFRVLNVAVRSHGGEVQTPNQAMKDLMERQGWVEQLIPGRYFVTVAGLRLVGDDAV